MEQYYYFPTTGQTYSGYQMKSVFGIDTKTTDLSIINFRGFYPVQESSAKFDTKFYKPNFIWSIIPTFVPGEIGSPVSEGEVAIKVFTASARPLSEAKERASDFVKSEANHELDSIVGQSGLSLSAFISISSQDALTRPAEFQLILDAMAAVTDQLATDLATIEAATSVEEIGVILNPPTGTITFHRSGANLIDGLFRDAGATDPDALTLSEGWAPEQFTLRLVTNDITVPYVLPEGFKEVGGGLGSGTQSVELKVGDVVIATFSLTTGTGDKIFTF